MIQFFLVNLLSLIWDTIVILPNLIVEILFIRLLWLALDLVHYRIPLMMNDVLKGVTNIDSKTREIS